MRILQIDIKKLLKVALAAVIVVCVTLPCSAQSDGGGKKKARNTNTTTNKNKKRSSASKSNSHYVPSESFVAPDYVDLGLPSGTMWATCNMGASKPEEYGDYFAWGEIKPKSKYTERNSKTYGKDIEAYGGNRDYDAATYWFGQGWMTPTEADFKELISKCEWSETTKNGISGFEIKGRNNKLIFLPHSGCMNDDGFSNGGYGYYGSSTPCIKGDNVRACFLWLHPACYEFDTSARWTGKTIRPVFKRK